MSNNVTVPTRLYFCEVDFTQPANIFTIAAGAGGWIDTDISGANIPVDAFMIYWMVQPTANTNAGVRAHGSALSRQYGITSADPPDFMWSSMNDAMHVDLYRHAGGDNVYKIVGYLSNRR